MHPAGNELLLRAVRSAIGTEGTDWLRQWRGTDGDCATVSRTAAEHGVLPLFSRGLDAVPPGALPEPARERVRRMFRANAERNLSLTAELLEVLALFEAHDIQAVAIKGPILAALAHGNVSLRQFTDLDVLVPAQTIQPAKALLTLKGYRFSPPGETSVAGARAGEVGQATLDLQWDLAAERYSAPIDGKRLFGRLERIPFMNTTVWQPAPDDQALMLCAHAAKHSWSRLGWLADFAAFIQSQDHRLDWHQTLDRARTLGGERLLLLGLQLSADLLRTPLPPQALPRLRADTVVAPLAQELAARMFSAPIDRRRLNGSYGFVEAGLVYMRSRERLVDKARYGRFLLRVLRQQWTVSPNAQDRRVIALPPFLGFLYFPIRHVRLLRKFGARAFRYGIQASACWR